MRGAAKAIIIVDDEVITLAAMRRELRLVYGEGFLIETALNADEADELIEDFIGEGVRVFVVISDWMMPGRKGDEFLAGVKGRHPGVRCVMVSGRIDPRSVEELRSRIDLDAALPKPWDRRTLLEVIDASLASLEDGGQGPVA